jgi:hypothetical protein
MGKGVICGKGSEYNQVTGAVNYITLFELGDVMFFSF